MIFIRLGFQTVVMALGQIWARKVRAMLTTLGIIIAVAAVIVVVSGFRGFEKFFLTEFEKIGTKRVYIDGELPESWRNRLTWGDVQLKEREVHAIIENCPSLSAIAPMWYGAYEVSNGRTRTLDSVQVVGIWPAWHEIENRQVIKGRPFLAADEEERRQVCLVNDRAIEELLLSEDPVGEFVLVGRRRFLIVGVVETLQMAGMFGGGDVSTEVFVPFATAKNLLNPDGRINMAWAQLRETGLADEAKGEITFVLRKLRHIKPDEEDTFEVGFMEQFIDQFNQVAVVATSVGGIVAGISLLVGGIGIMNIMLASVSERTREIGLRKAVGAQPVVILLQFLVEAAVLCLAGAVVGLALGQLMVFGLKQVPNMDKTTIPLSTVWLSVGVSAFTGLAFGMFPAIKAARLDPIEALRHE